MKATQFRTDKQGWLSASLFALTFLSSSVHASPLIDSDVLHARQDSSGEQQPAMMQNTHDAYNYTKIASPVNHTADLSLCKGYSASNVQTSDSGMTATLNLIGDECHAYGARDYKTLNLTVNYDTAERLHVLLVDSNGEAKQIPEEYLPPPKSSSVSGNSSQLAFSYSNEPSFSFRVTRRDTQEVLFDTSDAGPLVFEDQYVRIGTTLPENPNLYGLGEHNDNLHLPTSNYSRTLWNRDAGGLPSYTPLYGSFPIYHDHRLSNSTTSSTSSGSSASNSSDNNAASGGAQTHGVLLRNAHGMKIDIDNGTLVYNVLGGVLDFYFFAGPQPARITEQFHEVVGLPIGAPYWALGAHQCRYGYRDVFQVAATAENYTNAGIPIETHWSDIDIYDHREAFSTNPQLWTRDKVRSMVDWLHGRGQRYILMQDPAIAARDNPTYHRGLAADAFIKNWNGDGSPYLGVVWPGRTVFPDWTANGTQDWWTNEFTLFYGSDADNYTYTPVKGEAGNPTIPIDGVWLDMSEAANFLFFIDENPEINAIESGAPPVPPSVYAPPYEIPGLPWTAPPSGKNASLSKREHFDTYDYNNVQGAANLSSQWLYPPYDLNDTRMTEGTMGFNNYGTAKNLSDKTIRTDLVHANGYREYEIHNMFGFMFSRATHAAMLSRRPNKKPFLISRSTFLGSGSYTGHWLGDNLSTEKSYIQTVRNMLGHAIYGQPMVGADIGGFNGNSTASLLARWALLATFSPFYRNHNDIAGIPQEFYRYENSTRSAKKALDIRYRFLDAMYTSLHYAETKGTPILEPVFWRYPNDAKALTVENQYFALTGGILVSPATEINTTTVSAYIPDDVFYALDDWTPLNGNGSWVTFEGVEQDVLPAHVRGGVILPMRNESAMITNEVRQKPFALIIAPGRNGTAEGSLYIDDGVSIDQQSSTLMNFAYQNGTLTVNGSFDYTGEGAKPIEKLVFLGQSAQKQASMDSQQLQSDYNATAQTVTVSGFSKMEAFTVNLA